jgi:signal peptidase I
VDHLLHRLFVRWPAYVCWSLAVVVAWLAPVARSIGTETPTDRWVTTGGFVLAGLLIFLARRRPWAIYPGCGVLVATAYLSHCWFVVFVLVLPIVVFLIAGFLTETAHEALQLEHKPEPQERDGETASDFIESVATAFILALIVREFVLEAFKIPTGSMEPTIYGERYGTREGDRLLAAKAPLLFGEPERWSIVVFKYPLFRPTNFIKRLIGLPGEHLENRGGDIYVNGKCVAKPEEVQETLWFPLVPDDDGERAGGLASAYVADGAHWVFDGDGASCDAGADGPSWITHASEYGDVRASFVVDPSGLDAATGTVFVRLSAHGRRAELEATRDAIWLTAPGVARTKLDVEGLGTSKSRLAFAVADRVARVWRDGRLVARIETADEANFDELGNRAAFGVAGGKAVLADLRLEHDIKYTERGVSAWDVPEGCYFMLGDNTRASRDSREWRGRVWKTKDGREFVTDENSVRLDDGDRPRNPVTDHGEFVEMYDSYGVHRYVQKADLVETNPPYTPQPFVRREDLVGRAFLIFWPMPPKGEWRPRILP